jgi:hypothetical protein
MQFLNRRAVAAYVFILFLVVLMTGCGGGSGQSSADKKAALTVTQVDLFPAPSISLQPGEVTQLFAQALNSSGNQVFTQTITFNSGNPKIQIGTLNGQTLLCAGTWSDPANAGNAVVCTPTTAVPDTSNITASAGGVTSPTTIASIHVAVANVTVVPQVTPPLSSIPPCVNEGKTQIYKAVAKDINGVDITSTVGTFNWSSSQINVATIPATGDTGFTDQATATAVHPGDSNIIARIGTVTPIASLKSVFEQCLVKSIAVTVGTPDLTKQPPEDATHFTVATGATRALTAVVIDTTNTPLTTLPTLNWNVTQPSIAGVSGTGSVNGVAPGVVGISASCLPNNCNIGTNVTVTSNLVSGTITGTPSTSATAYVTCTSTSTPCTTVPSTGTTQTQLFPINGTTLGTAINLPQTPNSMMINPQNSRLYLGSAAGLMVVDAGANSLSATVISAPGTVLAVAPNGNAVVVSNGADVFLYNGSTGTPLLNGSTHVTNANAAAFSPDSGILLVVTTGGALWFESVGATPNFAATTATNVAFFPSGQFGAASRNGSTDYINIIPDSAGKPVINNTQTCGGILAQVPTLAATTPPTDQLLAADPSGTMCLLNTLPGKQTFAVPAFTASQVLTSPDGTHAYLIGGDVALQDYAIGSTALTAIALNPSATVTTGGIATNNTIYVGASDNSVRAFAFAGGVPTGAVTQASIPTAIPADLVVAKK